jgi:DNA-binding SARP family transcriptional activator/ABC-type transport system substrate-binding protein
VEFRLLGPVEALRDGSSVALGGAKPKALLALLLLHANEVVSRDRLIDTLWGDREPGTAGHSLDVQVSRLRKALEPYELVLTRSGGYVLEVDREAIDAQRFERLLEEGRQANAADEPARALASLTAALALWRGPALADLAYEDFARTEVERLEELRLVATEERIDAELALGHHARLVPELEASSAKHPHRERVRGQLMLALYRSGRQAEALRVYGETRKRLVDELGIEPGQALKDLEQAILRQDPALDLPRPLVARRRRLVAAAAAVAAAGVAAAAVVLVAKGGTESAQALAEPDSNVFLSAKTGAAVGEADVRDTVGVRFGAGSLWSVSSEGQLTRVDPETGDVVETIGLEIRKPGGIAFGHGSVWVTDKYEPTVLQIDPAVNQVVNTFHLPRKGLGTIFTGDVAVGAGSVWVGHGGYDPGAFVERLDLNTGRLQHRFPVLGGDADNLAFGNGVLWVASTASGELRKIDPGTGDLTKVATLRGNPCCIAAGDGYVWIATSPDNLVWKVSPLGTLVQSIKLPGAIKNITYADGAVWAAVGEEGTVVRIDGTTNTTRTYEVGHDVRDVDVHEGRLAVAVQENAADVTSDLKGDIVWVGRKAPTFFDSGAATDPAFIGPNWDSPQIQFHQTTCARLLNYADAEGEEGRELVPEVAEDFPQVSDNGRTYTFRIRKGFRFSPPSDEEVTAESFRHAIERALSPRMDPFGSAPSILTNIVGSEEYHAGKATHVSGVSARDDSLVIRLRKPAPDLPWLAAFSCAVPVDTPVVPWGLDTPVASAGPYYLAAHTDSVAVLKRNPNYGGTRPQRLDAIVFRFGVAPDDAATQIEAGILDYYLESQNPTLTPDTRAARVAGNRYRMTPDGAAGIGFFALNWKRPLFADIRMRRAVQYALDRSVLSRMENAMPATRLYSPKSPGFDDTPLYPVRPDLRTARALSGGREAHAVLLAFDPKTDPIAAAGVRVIRHELAAIGITVNVQPLTNYDFENDGAGFRAKAARSDISWGGINAHSADLVEYLQQLSLPQKEWDELNRIAKLSSVERERAAAALAQRIERKSLFAVYRYSAIPELVSRRLGCIVHQPEYAGVDLAALCMRGETD